VVGGKKEGSDIRKINFKKWQRNAAALNKNISGLCVSE